MRELETVKYLRSNGLAALVDQFKITVRRHGKHPNLVLLKYSQIDSPMGECIVQECRGLILDESDDWHVVAYPYNKFFNHGEGHAAAIDWSTAKVYEKLDGSLMTLYHYGGDWHVSSSGLPDAAGPVNGAYPGTFADLFWKTWGSRFMTLDFALCYMFELMTPYNRVVCRQEKSRLVLHGVRSLVTFEEHDPEPHAKGMGWDYVRSFPLTSISDCVAAAQAINAIDGEGFVVRDAAFNRIKVKSPQYVALAHLKDGFSGRRMLEIVRANESDEFLAHFPEYRPLYDKIRAAYDALCDGVDATFERIKTIDNRKEFATEAVKVKGAAALFAMKDGKAKSASEFFGAATMAGLERCIGIDLTVDECVATN